MGSRVDLHNKLISILGSGNVYFQPPPDIQMQYPCIVYTRSNGDTKFANNSPYLGRIKYDLTYIDANPDSPIVDRLLMTEGCALNRCFRKDGLNHDIFSIYF